MLDLTATGRALAPRLAASADANDTAFFDVLDATEKATLGQLIKALVIRHGLTGTSVDLARSPPKKRTGAMDAAYDGTMDFPPCCVR